MKLTIITPKGRLFSTEAEHIVLPGLAGEFTVLTHHAPIVAELGPGTISFQKCDRDPVDITGGYAEVAKGTVTAYVELKPQGD